MEHTHQGGVAQSRGPIAEISLPRRDIEFPIYSGVSKRFQHLWGEINDKLVLCEKRGKKLSPNKRLVTDIGSIDSEHILIRPDLVLK